MKTPSASNARSIVDHKSNHARTAKIGLPLTVGYVMAGLLAAGLVFWAGLFWAFGFLATLLR